MGFSINQCTERSTAWIQQVSTLENSSKHLHREKLDLLGEINEQKNQNKLTSQEEQAEIDKLFQSDDEQQLIRKAEKWSNRQDQLSKTVDFFNNYGGRSIPMEQTQC